MSTDTKNEKKELTPQQLQKRKKMLVYPLFFLLFIGSMWLIFAPSGGQDEQQADGFNPELPVPKDEAIVGDKRTAYEQEALSNKQDERKKNLREFAFLLEESEKQQEQAQVQEAALAGTVRPASGGLQASVNAYRDINRELNGRYRPDVEESNEQPERQQGIREPERTPEEKEQAKSVADEKLELMEKTLQMASKYMPGMQQPPVQGQAPFPPAGNQPSHALPVSSAPGKTRVQPVTQVHRNVVSLLAAPISNREFVEQYSRPRNTGFNTLGDNESAAGKNTIKACVNQTVTLTNGQEVQLRLLEAMQVGSVFVPENALITGRAKIAGERLDILIGSIQHADHILSVDLSVYDTDGQKGVFIPGSDEINALKEIGANAGGNLGSSISLTQQNAGQQLLTDLGRGVIQGGSQYIAKKMREVKVTLKAGYKVLLLPQDQ